MGPNEFDPKVKYFAKNDLICGPIGPFFIISTVILTPKGPLSLWGTNGIFSKYLWSQFLS